MLERSMHYRENNPDKVKEIRRKYCENNREKINERKRNSYAEKR